MRVDRVKLHHIIHESLQAPNMKNLALTKAMYTVIGSYDEQAFDNMSEESRK